jgi:hypothetical protein
VVIATAPWMSRVRVRGVAELTLCSCPVQTVFDLLGSKEDDITYSVGWGLAQSESFTRAVLAEAFGGEEQGQITAIRLQESVPGTGRTDVEIETDRLHLVIEAKRELCDLRIGQLRLHGSDGGRFQVLDSKTETGFARCR